MPYEFLDDAKQSIAQTVSQQQQPGFFTRVGLAGLRGIESPINLGNVGVRFLAKADPFSMLGLTSSALKYLGLPGAGEKPAAVSEDIMQRMGITSQQVKPQSLPESIIQRGAETVPTALALGGLPAAGLSALGSTTAGTAGYLGASPLVQDIIQGATEIGAGVKFGKIPTVKGQQKRFEEAARAAVKPGELHPVNAIKEAINSVERNLGTEANPKTVKKIRHVLGTIDQNISWATGEMNPNTARDIRKSLYQFRTELAPKDRHYIDALTKSINQNFALNIAENPEFYNNLKRADKFTEMKNMKSYVNNFVDVFDAVPGVGKVVKEIAKSTLGKTLGETEKLIKNLAFNPVAREHYFDVVKASIRQDPALFFKSVADLQASLEKKPKKVSKESMGRYELLD